uniref:KaiC-like domain-containing protein n=1 Tax=Thermofilum pendens TaxID=2269 RepID=A0A7C4B8K6_THEPE
MLISAKSLLGLPRLSTGLSGLDRLVSGLAPGSVSTFYGDEDSRGKMLYTLLASSVSEGLSPLVVNMRDYHSGRSIDTYALSEALLWRGIDPEEGLSRIHVANVYGVGQVGSVDLIIEEALKRGVELVAVTHLSELFNPKSYDRLVMFLGRLQRLLETGAVIVLFAGRSRFSKRPLPEVPVYVRHASSIIARLDDVGKKYTRITIEKGPLATPAILHAERTGWGLRDVEGWF